MATSMLIAFSYMFPNMMPAVCFGTYIGLGNYLDLSTAVTCIMFFGLMSGPMIWVPMAISDFIQLKVSMKRVQKFLQVDDVQKDLRVK
jgi:ABC-type bacteriocin/lantibiotic exporter with double-glycine peptidase domain